MEEPLDVETSSVGEITLKESSPSRLDDSPLDLEGINADISRGYLPPQDDRLSKNPDIDDLLNLGPYEKRDDVSDEPATQFIPSLGSIHLSPEGRLIQKWLTYEGFLNFSIELYEEFIEERLRYLISKQQIIGRDGSTMYRFDPETYKVVRPEYVSQGVKYLETPQRAIENKTSYNLKIVCSLRKYYYDRKKLVVSPDKREIELFMLPIMIGSKYSTVNRHSTKEELMLQGNCPYEYMGYFIIDGKKKTLLYVQTLRSNRILLIYDAVNATPQCFMTCDDGIFTSRVDIHFGYPKTFAKKTYRHNLILRVTHPRNRNSNIYLPVQIYVQFIYVFLYGAEAEYPTAFWELVLNNVTDDGLRNKIYYYLTADADIIKALLGDSKKLFSVVREAVTTRISTIKNRKRAKIPTPQVITEDIALRDLCSALFPHMISSEEDIFDKEGNLARRLTLLSVMVAKVLMARMGSASYDDRDNWGNKKLKRPDEHIYQRLAKLLIDGVAAIQYNLDTKAREPEDQMYYLAQEFDTLKDPITNGIRSSMKNNRWKEGARTNSPEHISDDLDTSSQAAYIGNMTRVIIQVDRRIKSKIRYQHLTQYLYICFTATPEGEACGLVNHLTIVCQLSRSVFNNRHEKELEDYISYLLTDQAERKKEGDTMLMLNGRYVGNCSGEETKQLLKELKIYNIRPETSKSYALKPLTLQERMDIARNEAYEDISPYNTLCIFMEGGMLWVDGMPGRPVAPLIRVERLNAQERKLLNLDNDKGYMYENVPVTEFIDNWEDLTTRQLISRGVIEYLDAREGLEFPDVRLANTRQEIFDGARQLYNLRSQLADLRTRHIALQSTLAPDRSRIKGQKIDDKRGLLETDTHATELGRKISSLEREIRYQEKENIYTHMSLHPASILSYLVFFVPLSNHNLNPRDTFACNMLKSAVGAVSSNARSRRDNTMRSIVGPTRPIVPTLMDSFLEDVPQGINVKVMMNCFGDNQEDAVIVSRVLAERMKYTYGKTIEGRLTGGSTVDGRTYSEMFGNPLTILKQKIEQQVMSNPRLEVGAKMARIKEMTANLEAKFVNLDSNGMARLGSYFMAGDCIIGKVRIMSEGQTQEDGSVYVGDDEQGRVDNIIISNSGGSQVRYVITSMVKRLIRGAKLFFREGQKMTLGSEYDERDMPFTPTLDTYEMAKDEKGRSRMQRTWVDREASPIHVIMNTQSMSRMTVGLLFEMLFGIYTSISGMKIDSTSFSEISYRKLTEMFYLYSYRASAVPRIEKSASPEETASNVGDKRSRTLIRPGYRTVYRGDTGEEVENQVYVGWAYFGLTKHLPDEKFKIRGASGTINAKPINATTRQPAGSSKQRAIKLGNMEGDVLAAHGVPKILKHLYCQNSDPHPMVMCLACRNPVELARTMDSFQCRCGNQTFGWINTSFAFALNNSYASYAGINAKPILIRKQAEEPIRITYEGTEEIEEFEKSKTVYNPSLVLPKIESIGPPPKPSEPRTLQTEIASPKIILSAKTITRDISNISVSTDGKKIDDSSIPEIKKEISPIKEPLIPPVVVKTRAPVTLPKVSVARTIPKVPSRSTKK